MNTIKIWLKNARPASLMQSLLPAAAVLIWTALPPKGIYMVTAFLALMGIGAAHLSMNLIDDYFDYKSHKTGYRDTLKRAGFRAYTAKCPYLTDGSCTMEQLLRAIAGFGILALICGAPAVILRGVPVVIVVAITAVLGVLYSGPPLRLSYHGLGEVVIGIIFGPLSAAGIALAAGGDVDGMTLALGTMFGLLVMNILFCHSVMDYDADISVGKHTLASLIPGKYWQLTLALFIFIPFILVALTVATGGTDPVGVMGTDPVGVMGTDPGLLRTDPYLLLVFLNLPLALDLFNSMKPFTGARGGQTLSANLNGGQTLSAREGQTLNGGQTLKWKFWYGPSGVDWQQARAAGIDWFIYRWLMARNLVGGFAFWLIIGKIIGVML